MKPMPDLSSMREILTNTRGVTGAVSSTHPNASWSYSRKLNVASNTKFQVIGTYAQDSDPQVYVQTDFQNGKLSEFKITRLKENIITTARPIWTGLAYQIEQIKSGEIPVRKIFLGYNTILPTWFSWPTQDIFAQLKKSKHIQCYFLDVENIKKIRILITLLTDEPELKIKIESDSDPSLPLTLLSYARDPFRLLDVTGFVYPKLQNGSHWDRISGQLTLHYDVE